MQASTVYICIDVEATGPIPDPYNLASIGAVPVQRAGRQAGSSWRVRADDLFYIELRPDYPGFLEEAMAIHGLTRSHLERRGLASKQAMEQLATWVLNHDPQPVFVGHNAVFDWAYVNHYFVRHGLANPFGWKGLDTKSLAAGVLRIPFLETSKENLARLLPDLDREDLALKHRADYDALYQGRILASLLNLQESETLYPPNP